MIKKAVVVLLLVFGLGLTYRLSLQIYNSLKSSSRLDNEASKLAGLQKKNMELKKQLETTQTFGFIESIARDKLGLIKPGESLVIIPDSQIQKVLSAQKKIEEIKLPNWQGWLRLFFH